MSLVAGTYIITSLDGKFNIGRYWIEDLSLLPKRVMTLPKTGPKQPTWEIIDCGDGLNKVKTGGSSVGVLSNGKVCAFLLEEMLQGAEWKFEHVPQHGENAYIILSKDKERGWSFDEDQQCQLYLNHVICTPTEPPHYMPNMVFTITPV